MFSSHLCRENYLNVHNMYVGKTITMFIKLMWGKHNVYNINEGKTSTMFTTLMSGNLPQCLSYLCGETYRNVHHINREGGGGGN